MSVTWENILSVSPIFGGIFLILGAFVLYKGKALLSLILYFFADICWLLMAIKDQNTFGTISILIGITFSTGVMLKMNNGVFHKDLKIKG